MLLTRYDEIEFSKTFTGRNTTLSSTRVFQRQKGYHTSNYDDGQYFDECCIWVRLINLTLCTCFCCTLHAKDMHGYVDMKIMMIYVLQKFQLLTRLMPLILCLCRTQEHYGHIDMRRDLYGCMWRIPYLNETSCFCRKLHHTKRTYQMSF